MLEKILIVEDDPRTRRTIEKFCREVRAVKEAEFCQAGNGQEAWEILADNIEKKQPFDLMFLDMEMPGMGGRELLEKLLKQGIRLNIIVVSGYDGFQYMRKAIQYGTVDYLLKPVNRKQVHEILEALALQDKGEEKARLFFETDSALDHHRSGTTMKNIRAYMEKNYETPITLADLARTFHYSREYISREFKKQYGVGIVRFLNDLRLERARILLEQGASVKKACEESGFVDDSYFARLFRERYGASPKKYQGQF
ncbi:MAG: response regulator [Lachnospiraceae bacterium]|jgi:YesN/AraC family two-component response regulator|nr:response regulator [Lachnospiraceae bacterium]